MQKVSVLNHAVEFYVQACESFVNPPEEYKRKVSECISLCKEINKNTAVAFSKNSRDEQLEYLDKAVKSGKDFRGSLAELEKNGLFSEQIFVQLNDLSYRTDREIKQIVPALLKG